MKYEFNKCKAPSIRKKRKFYWDGYKTTGKEFYKRWKETYGKEYLCWHEIINDNRSADILLQNEMMHQIRNEIDKEILNKLKELANEEILNKIEG